MLYTDCMKSYTALKKELLRDAKVKKMYDQLEPEFLLIQQLIRQRIESGMTQATVAKKLHTKQSAISRFESGTSNPTIDFLYRFAEALNVRLKITLS